MTERSWKEAAKATYAATNKVYKDTFKVDLVNTLVNLPELQLKQKKSRCEAKNNRRAKAKAFKTAIEKQWNEVDYDTMLCSRQSFSQRDLQRKALSMESFESAVIRTKKRKALVEVGTRKRKRHSPDPAIIDFDKEGLRQEVNEMAEGDMVR